MDPLHTPSAAAHLQPPRGWWSRNWKWFLPAGCLTFIVLIVGFVFAIVLLVFGAIKSSDVYQTALSAARNNAEVMEALGTPIDDGMFMTGKVNTEGPAGEASLSIPISGPRGSGTIFAEATKSAGRWSFTTLEVEVKGTGRRIDISPTRTTDSLEAEPDAE
jgi:hypothetical protein